KWRLKTIKNNIDKVLTIFPFEKEFYDKENIPSEFVGHPIVSEIPELNKRDEFFLQHGLDLNKKLVSVFPGSRMFEIKFLYNLFLKAVKLIEKERNDVQFVFSKAKSLKEDAFCAPYKTLREENQELLAYSDVLILASGTVALEAAMHKTPMLIAYKGPIFFYLVYLLVRNIKQACLVNIITKKEYVDEFLMFRATSENIKNCVNEILDNPQKREKIIEGCKKTIELLGKTPCAQNVAQIIAKEIK
ncbi:hypothetical protein IJ670_08265, partial [bacterium]|nr:hypothetical protein [bacterium]